MAEAIPKTMKALRVNKAPAESYSLEEVPVPEPTDLQALVKIGAGGLCHTDLMVLDGSFGGGQGLPVTGSHEPAGTVVALGEEAEKQGLIKVGTRVAGLLPIDVCYTCPDCKLKGIQYCPNSKYTGITTDGAFAEYELLDARHLVPLPDAMSFEQAAPLTCAGVTIYTAIRNAKLQPGDIIAISGLGALGSLGVQMAKAMGYKVIGIDARPEPVEMCRGFDLTPDILIDANKTSAEEAVAQIQKLRPAGYVGWDGADATVLTADAVQAQRYALDVTRRHGRFVLVAQPEEITLKYTDLIFRDLTVVGSLHGGLEDLKETVELCARAGIRSEVTRWKIEEHEGMVKSVHAEGRKGKAVLVF